MNVLNNPDSFNQVVDELFKFCDSNNSGNIDSDELYLAACNIFEQINHKIPTKEQTDELLKKVDADKSGKLDRDEFANLIRFFLSSLN